MFTRKSVHWSIWKRMEKSGLTMTIPKSISKKNTVSSLVSKSQTIKINPHTPVRIETWV